MSILNVQYCKKKIINIFIRSNLDPYKHSRPHFHSFLVLTQQFWINFCSLYRPSFCCSINVAFIMTHFKIKWMFHMVLQKIIHISHLWTIHTMMMMIFELLFLYFPHWIQSWQKYAYHNLSMNNLGNNLQKESHMHSLHLHLRSWKTTKSANICI